LACRNPALPQKGINGTIEAQTRKIAGEMSTVRKTVASVIGLLSTVASLAFWIEVGLGIAMGRVPGWINIGVVGWVAGWMLGLVLAGVATILWPKRWWLALPIPVLSFLAALAAVSVSHVNW
jgi:hypothetical protein